MLQAITDESHVWEVKAKQPVGGRAMGWRQIRAALQLRRPPLPKPDVLVTSRAKLAAYRQDRLADLEVEMGGDRAPVLYPCRSAALSSSLRFLRPLAMHACQQVAYKKGVPQR